MLSKGQGVRWRKVSDSQLRTLWPLAPRARAMAFPIPLDEPVTTATFGSVPASCCNLSALPWSNCRAIVVGRAGAATRHKTMRPEPCAWSNVHRRHNALVLRAQMWQHAEAHGTFTLAAVGIHLLVLCLP